MLYDVVAVTNISDGAKETDVHKARRKQNRVMTVPCGLDKNPVGAATML